MERHQKCLCLLVQWVSITFDSLGILSSLYYYFFLILSHMFQMTSFFVLCDGESIFFLQNLKLSLIYGATGVHDDNLNNWSVYMNIIYKQFALNVYNNRIYSTSKAHEFDIWTNQKKSSLKKRNFLSDLSSSQLQKAAALRTNDFRGHKQDIRQCDPCLRSISDKGCEICRNQSPIGVTRRFIQTWRSRAASCIMMTSHP